MAKLAFGTTLTWDGEVVAGIDSIGGVEMSVDEIDVSDHQSPDAVKEFLAGMITIGDVAIAGFFDETDTAGQHAMMTDAYARSVKTGIITAPTASGLSFTFTAFIKSIKIGDFPLNGAIPFTATLKITAKPTFAVAAVTGMSGIGFDNDVLIMPAFAIGKYEYVVTIANGQTETIITPVDATAGEIITITANGASQVVATGFAATAITLSATEITDVSIVISHASKAPKTYLFHCAVLAP